MNELILFKNEELGEIRTIVINGLPWFVGKDIASALGYERPTKAILDHVDIRDKDEVPIQDSIGRMQNTPIINEAGLYDLAISSKLPEAKRFRRWVVSEVIPSIRKNGMYAREELIDNPDFAIEVLKRLKAEKEAKEKYKNQIAIDQPFTSFGKAVAITESAVLIGEYAKLLRNDGINIGQNRLFEWFRDNGYLIKHGERRNEPMQRYLEMGLFVLRENCIKNENGDRINFTTKITGKGQLYFIEKLKSEFVKR